MVSDQIAIDKNSVDICLNPRWPLVDFKDLFELAKSVSEELSLQSHVWVATSGTTAENISGSKLVALSKAAVFASAAAVNKNLQSNGQDVWAQVLPLFHVGGIGIVARAQLSGAKVVTALQQFKWNVQHYYKVLVEQKCTLSALVPTQVFDLVQARLRSPPGLRAVVVGGASLNPELYQSARALGWPLLPSYGMSETCSQIAAADLTSLDKTEFPSINLLSHVNVKTNSEDFLLVQGTSLLTCYAQIQNGQNRHWDPKSDLWFQTDDKVHVQGRTLQILGRAQDYIKIGGEAVLVSRLREKLDSKIAQIIPNNALAFALVEMPSERLGSEIHLFFESHIAAEAVQQVQREYNEAVLPFERVRQAQSIEKIPRTELGKIRYSELRTKKDDL